jgi:radical SAM protein with 4Fe4S-binding SPASM domain
MNVTRTEVRAAKGLRTLSRVPNASGLYSDGFMVEPTTQCNLKCPLCPVPAHMHRPGIHMSQHTYREVVDAIKGHAKLMALWNFGEPFLNPEIFDMIRYAEERNVPVRVSTNSTFLEDREIDKIFESGLSSIIVCLDGASAATHERYRIGSSFEQVKAGIHRLGHRRHAAGRRKPHIRLQTLVFSYNEHEIDQMIDLAEAMRVDQLALKNVSLGSWVKEHLRERMARKMLPKDEKYRKYRVDEEGVELKIQDAVCSWAYENGVVLANGDVTTCCYDADGDHVFANVHRDGGLMTILRSEKMREVRDQIAARELPLCRTCQYSDYGHTMINFEYA